MDGISNFISLIVLMAGAYTIYAYVQMKASGKINTHLLLSKGLIPQQCKDEKAFIQECLPTVLVFGIVGVLYGVSDVMLAYIIPDSALLGTLNWIGLIVFLLVMVWYMVKTGQARKKYFDEIKKTDRKMK